MPFSSHRPRPSEGGCHLPPGGGDTAGEAGRTALRMLRWAGAWAMGPVNHCPSHTARPRSRVRVRDREAPRPCQGPAVTLLLGEGRVPADACVRHPLACLLEDTDPQLLSPSSWESPPDLSPAGARPLRLLLALVREAGTHTEAGTGQGLGAHSSGPTKARLPRPTPAGPEGLAEEGASLHLHVLLGFPTLKLFL